MGLCLCLWLWLVVGAVVGWRQLLLWLLRWMVGLKRRLGLSRLLLAAVGSMRRWMMSLLGLGLSVQELRPVVVAVGIGLTLLLMLGWLLVSQLAWCQLRCLLEQAGSAQRPVRRWHRWGSRTVRWLLLR